MTLRKERILEVERGRTRSHCVGNKLRKRLGTCRKADCRTMKLNTQRPLQFMWLRLEFVNVLESEF